MLSHMVDGRGEYSTETANDHCILKYDPMKTQTAVLFLNGAINLHKSGEV